MSRVRLTKEEIAARVKVMGRERSPFVEAGVLPQQASHGLGVLTEDQLLRWIWLLDREHVSEVRWELKGILFGGAR